MKSCKLVFFLVTMIFLASAVTILAPPTLAPASEEVTIIVTSTNDSGPGTLRQALLDAQSGDTITFDPTVFLPTTPVTISITSELPHIQQGNLTIDASNAGVILDGSKAPDTWVSGLQIVMSNANTIRGIQISNFPGAGISISGDAKDNMIGGDRSVGSGPFGQGNLTSSNDVGIVLSVYGTSQNTVMGNLIGTDAEGMDALGNHKNGIWIAEGANTNTIGPNNVIAHNHGPGIEVHDPDSLYNTITQNSIHDNGRAGIYQWNGGNNELLAPIIFKFDLQARTLTGVTCANCTVEVFSDNSDEGSIYEGRTTADDAGNFTFNKGTTLTGPQLTATTSDVDGNTSKFSLPTSGISGSLILQRANDLPIDQFQPKHSKELLDNRIGAQFDSISYQDTYDLTIYGRGVKRARVAINGLEPDLVDWGKPELSVDPGIDEIFNRMADNGITITYVLVFWDKATYPEGEGLPSPRFKTEDEIENYLEFVRFIVSHFKDRVQYYEIWNEPDIEWLSTKWIESPDYIDLVKRTVPVIRKEYPEAKITVGGVSNTVFPNASEYLFDILESDIMPLVDVVAWHPMYGTSPEYELYREYYYQYPSFLQEIKDTASTRGFDGEYQADEIGWSTPETAVPDQPWVYSPIVAAKYYSRGILMHLGMDIGVGAPDDNTVVHNLSTVMAGAKTVDLPIQIGSTITNTISYTFSLPNHDHLVALWNDGIAVDHDPGVSTTITLTGFTDHRVIGIDILHGFEQELITDTVGGDLVIRDLLVKDYPIILRIVSENNIFLPIVLNAQPRFFDGSFYVLGFADPPVDWEQAKVLAISKEEEVCETAHLATVTSLEEQEVISSLMEKTTANAWLGGFQAQDELNKDENWEWTTGEPFDFYNWAEGEPNDQPGGPPPTPGSEQYLEAYAGSGFWNDTPLEAKHHFIIEFENCQSPVSKDNFGFFSE